MKLIYLLFFIITYKNGMIVSGHFDLNVPDHKNVFDLDLYESVIDPELCQEQIRYIQENDLLLLIELFDSGYRTPRGVLTGNLLDLGNYYQCLGINRPTPNSVIEGKYCMINLPLNQNLPTLTEWPDDWPQIPDPSSPVPNLKTLRLQDEVMKRLTEYNLLIAEIQALDGTRNNVTRVADISLPALTFQVAVCIPKSCTTRTAINSMFGGSELGLIDFEETFCRLPNDKPWVAGDYVAVVIFPFIGLLVVLSTAYDLRHNVFLQKDLQKPKDTNKLFIAFSAFTNTRRLVTYTPVPGALECLDGIRSLAMMWVIIGHSFSTPVASNVIGNPMDVFNSMTSLSAVWIVAAPITVDTFFMLSGLLVVYTTAGKLTSMKLLKNLHLFYLNRLLRMFPVLAAVILLQVSLLNWIADGPLWVLPAAQTHNCRVNWWSTLLYIQNYVNPSHICLGHSWYLAIDIQLHIISPLVLVWVLSGRRRLAWMALVGALIAVLAASTTYNYIMKLAPGLLVPTRAADGQDYLNNYYHNTLPRASPFFVGLIFGYLLHLKRGKKVTIPLILVLILWVCALVISSLIVYSVYPIAQIDWDNQFADGMINSFMRPGWALFVGWIIFACVHGYGGPVNWLLSLRAWKVLSRLSYAMYLIHYPMMFVTNAMPVTLLHFSLSSAFFHFLADFTLTVAVAFILTIMIDAPFSVLIKHFMGGGPKRLTRKVVETETIEDNKPEISKP